MFTLNQLENSKNPVNQQSVRNELKLHGHPSSRKNLNGTFISTIQQRKELIEHYKFAHNL